MSVLGSSWKRNRAGWLGAIDRREAASDPSLFGVSTYLLSLFSSCKQVKRYLLAQNDRVNSRRTGSTARVTVRVLGSEKRWVGLPKDDSLMCRRP